MARIKMLGLVVLAVVLLPNAVSAQPPDTLWTKIYGGSDYDCGYSIAQTTDGGFIIAGDTRSYGAGNYDVYLIKTDVNGDTLWTKTYGSIYDEGGYSVVQTSDGGFIVAGYTYSVEAGGYDVYLVKTDANGDTIWTKAYGGGDSDLDSGHSVAQTTDGGYIITGEIFSHQTGLNDVYLMKTNADGDTLWTRTYGGRTDDNGLSVAQTFDGGYIITGYAESFGAGGTDVYLIKTDANGDTLWTRAYGGGGSNVGYSVAQTSDSSYIIAGAKDIWGNEDSADVFLIKTDIYGETLWTKTYGRSYWDRGYSVAQTSDGGYIVAGFTYFYPDESDSIDVYLIKTDANGDTLWTKTYGGGHFDEGLSVVQTTDGGYVIAGLTYSYGAGMTDVYLIRLGPEGSVEENSNLTAESPNLRLGQNPFSRTTTISYQIPARGNVTLSVYDITGREIKRLVDGVQERGDYQFQLDMTGYAEGVYFINLTAGKVRSVKKFIVLQ